MATALPNLSLHEGTDRSNIDLSKIVEQWLASLDQALQQNPGASLPTGLFLEQESFWRDILSVSWDRRTKHGQDAILEYLRLSQHGLGSFRTVASGALAPTLMDMGGMIFLQSGFSFENVFGSGTGLVRLVNVGPSEWQAWTVYTQLEELKEQSTSNASKDNNDLQVLVIGGGHCGLMLGARFQKSGLSYRIIESSDRIGDSWRRRYRSIKLHTPTWTDEFPYLPFPKDYPDLLEQDQISDWQEHYAKQLDLKVDLKSTVKHAAWDESKKLYRVTVDGPQGQYVLTPRHIVLATGIFTSTPLPIEFPGVDSFKGQVYHSVQHTSARDVPDIQNKRVVIVGASTSAHDVAEDFVNAGAKGVSLVQRGPIFSFTMEAIVAVVLGAFRHLPIEELDLMLNSFPTAIVRTMSPFQTQAMASFDKDLLDGLEKQGLSVLRGDDGVGFAEHQFVKLGHWYIDQGASQMIVDGKIKILRDGKGVTGFHRDGVVLGNGTEAPADVVVLATGMKTGDSKIEEIFGANVKEQVGNLAGLDSEQEFRGWWRPTGFPGLWYLPGNFMWGRQFSHFLALQIKAIEDGQNPVYWEENIANHAQMASVAGQ
ncbi:hypothetical protein PRZ48_015204 [Zasmidium cellare]|uniref:Flavin-containing monooxygenase n=1 Tax=Zasmidium cellare TaxID=395010 RepID=A0ABR0DYF3_ZASCE|nr:hypothetical protein PRZ48_015204 [Zasmidium cellare]